MQAIPSVDLINDILICFNASSPVAAAHWTPDQFSSSGVGSNPTSGGQLFFPVASHFLLQIVALLVS